MAADFNFGGSYVSESGNPYSFGVSDDGLALSWDTDEPELPATPATTRIDPKLIAGAALAAVLLVLLVSQGD